MKERDKYEIKKRTRKIYLNKCRRSEEGRDEARGARASPLLDMRDLL